jgi:ribosome biogenesis GTPase
MGKKKQKIRTDLRKNRNVRTRETDFTRQFEAHGFEKDDTVQSERISGKGELARRRTLAGAEVTEDDAGLNIQLSVDPTVCRLGRVLRVQGLVSTVRIEENDDSSGQEEFFKCATRGLLKTLSTDQRHVLAAGDRVWVRPQGNSEGVIERVEPRRGVLSRTSRGRQHIIVANVDQLVIVGSPAEPYLKPNLIDRYLVTAEKARITPLIVINKIDLVDPADVQPLVGVYSQMGYNVLLTSSVTGQGIERLRAALAGRESVFSGQSGVGKSSLLNVVDDGLGLRVQSISSETQKGRHTTTTAELIPLTQGGYVVDTPGIRQFQLWDVVPAEVAGFFRDIRPLVSLCRFPDCTHTHELDCAVKDAVADGWIDARRYESYAQIVSGD